TNSYIEETPADNPTDQTVALQEGSESKVRRAFGDAMLMVMLSADLVLGFLVGLLTRMRTNEDYAAWHALKKTNELVTTLEKRVSEFVSSIEIAKKRCMAGILRA